MYVIGFGRLPGLTSSSFNSNLYLILKNRLARYFKASYCTLIFWRWRFNIFLLRQFIKTLPIELDQAAKIDGANSFQIYYKILLPIIKPALMTVAVMSVAFHWNDFMTPLIYLNSDQNFTLALGLQFFKNSYGSSQVQMLMAVSLITVIPLLILFFIGQKYFVQGITMSGLKG